MTRVSWVAPRSSTHRSTRDDASRRTSADPLKTGPFFADGRRLALGVPPMIRGLLAASAVSLLAGAWAPIASAQDAPSARCRRVRATAASQASLAIGPTLWVEGVHVPYAGDESGSGAIGRTGSSAWQLRASLSASPIDIARGFLVLDAAETECQQLDALDRARHTLELGAELGELAATRAERDTLLEGRATVDATVAHASELVARGLATAQQLDSVRSEANRLARRMDQLAAETARLERAGHDDAAPEALAADLEAYEASTLELEHRRSTIRRLSPYTVNVRGGVIPLEPVDWFGMLQVGVNLGAVAQADAEDALLHARADELAGTREELRGQLHRLTEQLEASLGALRDDLRHVDVELELATHQRSLLANAESAETATMLALVDLRILALRAERAHTQTLLTYREGLVLRLAPPGETP